MKIEIDNNTARKFILLKHGLLGEYKFIGKHGILDFIHSVGSIQYDPIDVCGKNSELVLQSRIKNFTKDMLYELLYQDRLLVDYFDKNLSIFPIEEWKCFSRMRNGHKNFGRSKKSITPVRDLIKNFINENKYACSKDLNLNAKTDWYWNKSSLARVALETMYFQGDLAIHHKKGTLKYYSLIEQTFPSYILAENDPFETEYDYKKWLVLRRIGAVGLLWNKASDAFLGIGGWMGISRLSSLERNKIFTELEQDNMIIPVKIDGNKDIFYIISQDISLLNDAITHDNYLKRMELIAPLDNLLWDRKLINQLFCFDYKWEIYTPASKRKYGYYVLPILWGTDFVGRVEIINNKKEKQLFVKNIYLEDNFKLNALNLMDCLKRFSTFNGAKTIVFDECMKHLIKIS